MSGHGFSAGDLAGLGGPTWLARRREEALSAYLATELPTEAEEEWHYSRVAELDLDGYGPPRPATIGGAAPGELPATAAAFLEAVGPRAGLVVTAEGRVDRLEVSPAAAAAGLVLSSLESASDAPDLLAPLAAAPDAFALLGEAFVTDGVVVSVPARAVIEEPVVLVHLVGDASAGRLVAPRVLVAVGEQAEASVVELFVSGDEAVLVLPATELHLADGAHLSHLSVQQLGSGAWQLANQQSTLGRDARLASFVAALGGSCARQRTHSVLAGEGGESRLLAVYLADGEQVQSFRTVQEHVAPRTKSELVFKGAVADRARSAYTGLVRMHRGARRADASQTNRNLVLSEGARADSVPNLDIQENDVRCSHASAVGPIDTEQRFYLETRGVPTEVAERLVLLGFFEELVARAPHAGVAAFVRRAVTGRLAAATAGEPALARTGGGR